MTTLPPSADANQLIASCQGLVRSIAWKIHRRLPPQVEMDDLVGYGQIGLAEAARDYDAGRGTQFTTFAYYRIRGAILDGLSSMAWFNKADYNRGRYEQMADDLLHTQEESSGGRLPDDVQWFRSVTGTLAIVYLFSGSGDGDESGGPQVQDDSAGTPEQRAISRELSEKLHALVDELPEDERELIRGAYFDGLSLKEAGERIGISKAWASRLHARTLQRLAHALAASS